MSESLEIGSPVKYHTGDAKWKNGTIHAVRMVDTEAGPQVLAYLVDTGRDHRVDEFPFDHRDREITKRYNEKLAKHKNLDEKKRREALDEILAHDDLPESKVEVERIRQPEQVDIKPENIKPA